MTTTSTVTEKACPQCSSTEGLATVELLEAEARFSGFIAYPDSPNHQGGTDVDWNSSRTIGVRCTDCRSFEYRGVDWADVLAEPDSAETTGYARCAANPDRHHGPLRSHDDPDLPDGYAGVQCSACGTTTTAVAVESSALDWG